MAELRAGTTIGGFRAIHSNNLIKIFKTKDGSGSGVDSDTVDGYHADQFLHTTGGNMSGYVTFTDSNSHGNAGTTLQIGYDSANMSGSYLMSCARIKILANTDNIGIEPIQLASGQGITTDETKGFLIYPDTIKYNNNTVWHAGNDGSGSGLDADLLDGEHASAFVHKTGDTMSGPLKFTGSQVSDVSTQFQIGKLTDNAAITSYSALHLLANTDNSPNEEPVHIATGVGLTQDLTRGLTVYRNDIKYNNNTVWHAGNDGSGSGLDADLLDGIQSERLVYGDNISKSTDEIGGFNKTSSGFKRHNGSGNIWGGLAIHVAHPDCRNGEHARGIAFDYGSVSNKLYTYGYNDHGDLAFINTIYHDGWKPTPADIGAINKAGDTMNGILGTPNNSRGILLGDDIYLCDRDIANHMILEGGADATQAGITFGSGKDTNIYRGGANLLKTDDIFNAVGGYQWNGQSLDERYFARRWEIGNDVDWNSIIHPGCYKVQQSSWGNESTTHSPNQGYSFGLLMVYRTSVEHEDRIQQIFMPHSDNSPFWFRMCNNGTWNRWSAIDVRPSADNRYYTKAPKDLSGTDLNTVMTGGIYTINPSCTNIPEPGLWGQMFVMQWGDSSIAAQIYTVNRTGKMYIRNKDSSNTTWSNWAKVYDTNNKPTPSEIGAVNKAGDTMTGRLRLRDDFGGGLSINNISVESLGDNILIMRNVSQIRFGTDNEWQYDSWAGVKYDTGSRVLYVGGAGGVFNGNAGTNIDINLRNKVNNIYVPNMVSNNWFNFNDTNNVGIKWGLHTDFAQIYFKNDGDGDPDSYLHFQTGDNGDEYMKFSISNTQVMTIKGDGVRATKIWGAVYNDYAEYFEKGEEIEPGDVVVLNENSDKEEYVKCREANSSFVVGVCSDEFFQCIGGNGDGKDEENFTPIGMAGRVKVKLVGKAKKGDLITSSDIPGVAMVAENPKMGTIIGKCLENKETDEIERVRMLIQLS